jgi:hypothetical protein
MSDGYACTIVVSSKSKTAGEAVFVIASAEFL